MTAIELGVTKFDRFDMLSAKDLRIGDRIRFLRMPSTFTNQDFRVPPETLALYRHLIATGDTVTIGDFLDDGYPIAGYEDRRDPGNPELHGLVIDDIDNGCWERVE